MADRKNSNPMRQRAIEGLREGDAFTYTRIFTQGEAELFGELTRDYNPVHYDRRWAEAKGFNGLICHGLLVASMICEFGGQVGWLATGMNIKYIKPVYFGDTIHCSITITKIEKSGRAESEAFFTNGDNEQVCYAYMTGRIPLEQDRDLLRHIVDEGDVNNKLSVHNGPSHGT